MAFHGVFAHKPMHVVAGGVTILVILMMLCIATVQPGKNMPITAGDKLIFIRSRAWLFFVFVLLLLVFVSATASIFGLISLQHVARGPQIPAWMGSLFASYFLVRIVGSVFRPSAKIILDRSGFHDRFSGIGKIPWSDITGASLVGIKNQSIVLLINNYEKYAPRTVWQKLSFFNGSNGAYGQIAIKMAGLRQHPRSLLDAIRIHIESCHKACE